MTRFEDAEVNEHDETEVPLNLLLLDSAEALELVKLHGLARACRVANTIITGIPASESFVVDILECLEKANDHARHNTEATRLALQSSIDVVCTWGLQPERRLTNAIREIVCVLEAIRQQVSDHEALVTEESPKVQARKQLDIAKGLAERGLGALGFPPHKEDEAE
jgi:hypothetical protein